MSFLLVTGTDTGVGKTWVSRALARALMNAGHRVLAIKPVESGCIGSSGADEDGAMLAAATGQVSPVRALCRLAAPLAPAVACDDEAMVIDLDELVLEIESHASAAEIVLIEGAGGVLTPFTWEWNVVDLARALDARALVVTSDRLGAINQALLALGALEFAGVEICGVALTPPAEPDQSTGGNADAIAHLSGLGRIAVLPRNPDPLAAAVHLAGVVEWVLPR